MIRATNMSLPIAKEGDRPIRAYVYADGSAMLSTEGGSLSVCLHLRPAEFKALILQSAEALGIFACEQDSIGQTHGGIRPPDAVLKDRDSRNAAFRSSVERAAGES